MNNLRYRPGLQAATGLDWLNIEALDAIAPAEQFQEDPETTAGLVWGYKAGVCKDGSTLTLTPAGTVALSASATNYVEIDPTDGTISTNTTGWTADLIALRQLTTDGNAVVADIDARTLYTSNAAGVGTTGPAGATGAAGAAGATGPAGPPGPTTLMFAQTTTVIVTNTTAKTSLAGAGAGSRSVVGGTAVTGDTFRIQAMGVYSTKASAPGTLALEIDLGAVVLVATAAITLPVGVSSLPWRLDVLITVRTAGTSGTTKGQGAFSYQIVAADRPFEWALVGTATVNTMATASLDLLAQFSAADAANSITCDVLLMERRTVA